MTTKVSVRFTGVADFKRALMKELVQEQTRRLTVYAADEIARIGNKIRSYHSRHHMDRTGNLLDSLCWGVTYKGEMKASGFYREQTASRQSFLHEWFNSDIYTMFPVYGHGLAQQFLDEQSQGGGGGGKGWTVFFAILAPYWGYWEKGFRMRTRRRGWDEDDATTVTFMRFAVMTETYDEVKRDLKPADVNFKVFVPKYNIYNPNRRNYLQAMRDRIANNSYKEENWFSKYPKFHKK